MPLYRKGDRSIMGRFARLLIKRTEEIISCILSSYLNRRMEGTNNRINLIKRRGCGYRNIQRFVLRVRLWMATIL
ncbi:transposase [Anoxybacillus sp. FSL W8-0104]|uniref:transposase n=1 Tax=unclassified Anoxybacillus TaxID=2639704 RepID=UPI004040376E